MVKTTYKISKHCTRTDRKLSDVDLSIHWNDRDKLISLHFSVLFGIHWNRCWGKTSSIFKRKKLRATSWEFKINDAISGLDGFRLSIKAILFVRFVWHKKRRKNRSFFIWNLVENFCECDRVPTGKEFPLDMLLKAIDLLVRVGQAKIFSFSVVLARWFDQPSITRKEAFCLTDVLDAEVPSRINETVRRRESCLFSWPFIRLLSDRRLRLANTNNHWTREK